MGTHWAVRGILISTGCVLTIGCRTSHNVIDATPTTAPVAVTSTPLPSPSPSPDPQFVGHTDGWPFIADIDFRITGVPEVHQPMTVTATFTVPPTSGLVFPFLERIEPPPTPLPEASILARLFIGDMFQVVSMSHPCTVCRDGENPSEFAWPMTVSTGELQTIVMNVVPLAPTPNFTGVRFWINDTVDPAVAVSEAWSVRVGPPGEPGEIK